MAATKRQMNITACTFTPTAGSATTFTGVTGVETNAGGSLVGFDGDADRFTTTLVNDFNDPSVSINHADFAAGFANPTGTHGTLTYTYKDAKGATGGSVVATVTGAVVENNSFNGQHRQFGTVTTTFKTESSDGTTNPLAFTTA